MMVRCYIFTFFVSFNFGPFEPGLPFTVSRAVQYFYFYFILIFFVTVLSKFTFRYILGQRKFKKKQQQQKKKKQGVSTLCAKACLLNTRSTIHNKLRKIDIDINVHRYTTLKGDIAKKYLFLLLWSLMITHIYIYCTV